MNDSDLAVTDEIRHLAECFVRAKLLHENVHQMREEFGTLPAIVERGHWVEFKSWLALWLSSLYVVAEGYRELGLVDTDVDRTIDLHLASLKRFRNGTFHFQFTLDKQHQFFLGSDRINWAEELHEAFHLFFKERFPIMIEE